MSKSDTKKIVDSGTRGMAHDHLTVANAARILNRNDKEANLSSAGAADRLQRATTPVDSGGTNQPSSSPATPEGQSKPSK